MELPEALDGMPETMVGAHGGVRYHWGAHEGGQAGPKLKQNWDPTSFCITFFGEILGPVLKSWGPDSAPMQIGCNVNLESLGVLVELGWLWFALGLGLGLVWVGFGFALGWLGFALGLVWVLGLGFWLRFSKFKGPELHVFGRFL